MEEKSFRKIIAAIQSKHEEELLPLCDETMRDICSKEDEVKTSIGCWVKTRINGISSSMGCDYATADIVIKLDELISNEERNHMKARK